jgi:hypothetical protein
MDEPVIQKIIKTRIKKPNFDTKIGKYFIAIKRGKSKTGASIVAGYPDPNHTTRIEATKTYQAMETYYRDELLKGTPISHIVGEHIRCIDQDIDQGAKIKAIERAYKSMGL